METDDAHERRLTQVLLALALFFDYLEASKRAELITQLKIIFDSGKFWKLDKIKSVHVSPHTISTCSKTVFILVDSKFILPLPLRVDESPT